MRKISILINSIYDFDDIDLDKSRQWVRGSLTNTANVVDLKKSDIARFSKWSAPTEFEFVVKICSSNK